MSGRLKCSEEKSMYPLYLDNTNSRKKIAFIITIVAQYLFFI